VLPVSGASTQQGTTGVLDQNLDQATPARTWHPSPALKDEDARQGHECELRAHYVAFRPPDLAGYGGLTTTWPAKSQSSPYAKPWAVLGQISASARPRTLS
jgi:hypothetical protein